MENLSFFGKCQEEENVRKTPLEKLGKLLDSKERRKFTPITTFTLDSKIFFFFFFFKNLNQTHDYQQFDSFFFVNLQEIGKFKHFNEIEELKFLENRLIIIFLKRNI